MIEIERKYLNIDIPRLRAALARLGASSLGAHFESNTLFDTHDLSLAGAGRILRLRHMEWPDRESFVLTFKKPAIVGAGADIKAREEIETRLESGSDMRSIFLNLGYEERGRYEKTREEWLFQPGGGDDSPVFKVDIDCVNFGDVAELEGSPEYMDMAAGALGLSEYETSALSYHELHQKWRVANGMPAMLDMVFEPARKKQLRASLGLPN